MADLPPIGRAQTTDDAHDGHDPLLIAALLDRDPSDASRSVAELRVSTCPECAALHADLVALATATTELPAAVRTRDFRLTAGDAARLATFSPGEPLAAGARLTREMTKGTTNHADHDQWLIASLLDRSQSDPERDRAEALVAACDDCAALHRDLVALSAATRALPTPPRPRDFTLSPDDVARLRPGVLRRLLAAFGSSRDIVSRPLAIGLTTIGLAGLLVVTVPSILSGQRASVDTSLMGQSINEAGAGSGVGGAPQEAAPSAGPSAGPAAAAPETAPSAPSYQVAPAAGASAAPEASAAAAPVAVPPATSPSDDSFDNLGAGPVASAGDAAVAPDSNPTKRQDGSSSTGAVTAPGEPAVEGSSVIALASILLALGLGLFALRWAGRRLGDG